VCVEAGGAVTLYGALGKATGQKVIECEIRLALRDQVVLLRVLMTTAQQMSHPPFGEPSPAQVAGSRSGHFICRQH
jgi:hypothetical protein